MLIFSKYTRYGGFLAFCLNGVVMADDGKNVVLKEEEKVQELHQDGVVTIPKETFDFFGNDEIRARVFYEKYALKDESGKIIEKTPKEMWHRVAKAIAAVEAGSRVAEWQEKFEWLLSDFKFVPGGRIMFGAGQPRRSTLLNCYVIPIREDSIEAIFDWCKEAARTYSFGGGVGTDISILRPKGAPVNNSAVYSTGSTSFMNIFSETTHTIGQSGRRGALMITISVDHPDIMNFINIKKDLSNVRYANISVRVTDEFMRAVEGNGEFTLRYEGERVGRFEKKVMARDVWSALVSSARDWAEPGLIFWDAVKKYSPSEYNGMEVVGTNPCSEQPLDKYGACDLGNINLSAFVLGPFTSNGTLDWQNLEKTVRYGVRFLDDVLDYNDPRQPLQQQRDAARNSRRIGIGVTGLADMLIKLGMKYDTDEALMFVDELFDRIKQIAYDESIEIAKEKGSFGKFESAKHLSMPFIQALPQEIKDKISKYGLRNVAILTIPPVGSGSVLAGTSSGIEPVFAFEYTRRSESLSQEYFKVYHPLVLDYIKRSGLAEGAKLPDYFIPAHKINAEFRVKMQGTIQKHIDSAISSTVNLPSDTTVERVEQIYMQAWKAGCKGITVYREGSREGILITNEETEKETKDKVGNVPSVTPAIAESWERPYTMSGQTIKINTPQGALYVTANAEEGDGVREVFINLGKTGSDEKSYTEAIGRLISKYLQLGGDVKEVISSLKGIRANVSISWDRGMKIYSIPDAIAKGLEIMAGITKPMFTSDLRKSTAADPKLGRQLPIGAEAIKPEMPGNEGFEACVACGEKTAVHENGCYICKSCGYTVCD